MHNSTLSTYAILQKIRYNARKTAAMYYGNEIETIIYYESGHILYNVKIGNGNMVKKRNPGSKSRRHKLAVLKQMYRRAKKDGYATGISNWATKNEKEFFAEIFAAENLDKKGIPDYIKLGIQEILK